MQAFFVDLLDGQVFHTTSETDASDAARTPTAALGDTRSPATHASSTGATVLAMTGSRDSLGGHARAIEKLISRFKDNTEVYETLEPGFDRCACSICFPRFVLATEGVCCLAETSAAISAVVAYDCIV